MVGIMDSANDSNISTQRDDVLKLMDEKAKMETEMKMYYDILEQNNIGMDEPLIDVGGYPRSDMDLYRVRHARHSIICIRNDLKIIMRAIEEGLHSVHALAAFGPGRCYQPDRNIWPGLPDSAPMEPIARVKTVVPDSPAHVSGLLCDDLIIEFGSVNSRNFKSLDDILKVVQHSVNTTVILKVQRGESNVLISLCPKQWSGRGLLGCTILPIENSIER